MHLTLSVPSWKPPCAETAAGHSSHSQPWAKQPNDPKSLSICVFCILFKQKRMGELSGIHQPSSKRDAKGNPSGFSAHCHCCPVAPSDLTTLSPSSQLSLPWWRINSSGGKKKPATLEEQGKGRSLYKFLSCWWKCIMKTYLLFSHEMVSSTQRPCPAPCSACGRIWGALPWPRPDNVGTQRSCAYTLQPYPESSLTAAKCSPGHLVSLQSPFRDWHASSFSSTEIKKRAPWIRTPPSCWGLLARLFPLLLFLRLMTSSSGLYHERSWSWALPSTFTWMVILKNFFHLKEKSLVPRANAEVKSRGSWPSALSGWRSVFIQGLWPWKDWKLRLDTLPCCPVPLKQHGW